MLAFTIILSWCFIVACACVLGTNNHLKEMLAIASGLRGDVREAQREKELAREKAKMLLQYVDTDREYRTFDDVLNGLPVGHYRGHPRQHRVMEAKQFDLAAYNAVSEPCADSMTLTVLAFDAVRLYFDRREYTGWERGKWVMVPKEALSR
jgi:hypothetical protein